MTPRPGGMGHHELELHGELSVELGRELNAELSVELR